MPAIPLARMPAMARCTILLFACAAGMSVANVYYAQPLLDAVARDMSMSLAATGTIVAATQLGSVLALLFLVPLGDLLERKRLLLAQLLALVLVLLMVTQARTATQLLAAMLLTGLLGTAMTQGLISYAASAARPDERSHVVGIAQGGVVTGLLLARVLAGGIGDLAGWRSVYGYSAGAMLLIAAWLWRALPALPAPRPGLRYRALLGSMAALLLHHRTLQVRGVLALLMFAALNVLWSALVLPLSEPPFNLSHTAIGAFGLAGVAGALAALGVGRLVDRGRGALVTSVALCLMLVAWLPLALMPTSLNLLVLGIVLLDMGGQALHVTNQGLILRDAEGQHSRLIGAYMLFYAAGSGLGAMATSTVYAYWRWTGVCVLGASISLAALLFWALTRHMVPARTSGDAVRAAHIAVL